MQWAGVKELTTFLAWRRRNYMWFY